MVSHEAREICIGFHDRLFRCVRAPGGRRAWHGGAPHGSSDGSVVAVGAATTAPRRTDSPHALGWNVGLFFFRSAGWYRPREGPPHPRQAAPESPRCVWRGVQLGSPRGAGRSSRMLGGGGSHEPQAYTFDPSSSMERARGEHVGRLSRQHPPPLRYRERLLRALARSAARVHLCVLSVSRHESGGGAGGQRWTTSAASCSCSRERRS